MKYISATLALETLARKKESQRVRGEEARMLSWTPYIMKPRSCKDNTEKITECALVTLYIHGRRSKHSKTK